MEKKCFNFYGCWSFLRDVGLQFKLMTSELPNLGYDPLSKKLIHLCYFCPET